ncbi:unnamed protein product [Amoebophrya sp. A120]|nr:unnamed protein product [Amoebophrya sp. A120]|eukprot:GSA120T00018251001.1
MGQLVVKSERLLLRRDKNHDNYDPDATRPEHDHRMMPKPLLAFQHVNIYALIHFIHVARELAAADHLYFPRATTSTKDQQTGSCSSPHDRGPRPVLLWSRWQFLEFLGVDKVSEVAALFHWYSEPEKTTIEIPNEFYYEDEPSSDDEVEHADTAGLFLGGELLLEADGGGGGAPATSAAATKSKISGDSNRNRLSKSKQQALEELVLDQIRQINEPAPKLEHLSPFVFCAALILLRQGTPSSEKVAQLCLLFEGSARSSSSTAPAQEHIRGRKWPPPPSASTTTTAARSGAEDHTTSQKSHLPSPQPENSLLTYADLSHGVEIVSEALEKTFRRMKEDVGTYFTPGGAQERVYLCQAAFRHQGQETVATEDVTRWAGKQLGTRLVLQQLLVDEEKKTEEMFQCHYRARLLTPSYSSPSGTGEKAMKNDLTDHDEQHAVDETSAPATTMGYTVTGSTVDGTPAIITASDFERHTDSLFKNREHTEKNTEGMSGAQSSSRGGTSSVLSKNKKKQSEVELDHAANETGTGGSGISTSWPCSLAKSAGSLYQPSSRIKINEPASPVPATELLARALNNHVGVMKDKSFHLNSNHPARDSSLQSRYLRRLLLRGVSFYTASCTGVEDYFAAAPGSTTSTAGSSTSSGALQSLFYEALARSTAMKMLDLERSWQSSSTICINNYISDLFDHDRAPGQQAQEDQFLSPPHWSSSLWWFLLGTGAYGFENKRWWLAIDNGDQHRCSAAGQPHVQPAAGASTSTTKTEQDQDPSVLTRRTTPASTSFLFSFGRSTSDVEAQDRPSIFAHVRSHVEEELTRKELNAVSVRAQDRIDTATASHFTTGGPPPFSTTSVVAQTAAQAEVENPDARIDAPDHQLREPHAFDPFSPSLFVVLRSLLALLQKQSSELARGWTSGWEIQFNKETSLLYCGSFAQDVGLKTTITTTQGAPAPAPPTPFSSLIAAIQAPERPEIVHAKTHQAVQRLLTVLLRVLAKQRTCLSPGLQQELEQLISEQQSHAMVAQQQLLVENNAGSFMKGGRRTSSAKKEAKAAVEQDEEAKLLMTSSKLSEGAVGLGTTSSGTSIRRSSCSSEKINARRGGLTTHSSSRPASFISCSFFQALDVASILANLCNGARRHEDHEQDLFLGQTNTNNYGVMSDANANTTQTPIPAKAKENLNHMMLMQLSFTYHLSAVVLAGLHAYTDAAETSLALQRHTTMKTTLLNYYPDADIQPANNCGEQHKEQSTAAQVLLADRANKEQAAPAPLPLDNRRKPASTTASSAAPSTSHTTTPANLYSKALAATFARQTFRRSVSGLLQTQRLKALHYVCEQLAQAGAACGEEQPPACTSAAQPAQGQGTVGDLKEDGNKKQVVRVENPPTSEETNNLLPETTRRPPLHPYLTGALRILGDGQLDPVPDELALQVLNALRSSCSGSGRSCRPDEIRAKQPGPRLRLVEGPEKIWLLVHHELFQNSERLQQLQGSDAGQHLSSAIVQNLRQCLEDAIGSTSCTTTSSKPPSGVDVDLDTHAGNINAKEIVNLDFEQADLDFVLRRVNEMIKESHGYQHHLDDKNHDSTIYFHLTPRDHDQGAADGSCAAAGGGAGRGRGLSSTTSTSSSQKGILHETTIHGYRHCGVKIRSREMKTSTAQPQPNPPLSIAETIFASSIAEHAKVLSIAKDEISSAQKHLSDAALAGYIAVELRIEILLQQARLVQTMSSSSSSSSTGMNSTSENTFNRRLHQNSEKEKIDTDMSAQASKLLLDEALQKAKRRGVTKALRHCIEERILETLTEVLLPRAGGQGLSKARVRGGRGGGGPRPQAASTTAHDEVDEESEQDHDVEADRLQNLAKIRRHWSALKSPLDDACDGLAHREFEVSNRSFCLVHALLTSRVGSESGNAVFNGGPTQPEPLVQSGHQPPSGAAPATSATSRQNNSSPADDIWPILNALRRNKPLGKLFAFEPTKSRMKPHHKDLASHVWNLVTSSNSGSAFTSSTTSTSAMPEDLAPLIFLWMQVKTTPTYLEQNINIKPAAGTSTSAAITSTTSTTSQDHENKNQMDVTSPLTATSAGLKSPIIVGASSSTPVVLSPRSCGGSSFPVGSTVASLGAAGKTETTLLQPGGIFYAPRPLSLRLKPRWKPRLVASFFKKIALRPLIQLSANLQVEKFLGDTMRKTAEKLLQKKRNYEHGDYPQRATDVDAWPAPLLEDDSEFSCLLDPKLTARISTKVSAEVLQAASTEDSFLSDFFRTLAENQNVDNILAAAINNKVAAGGAGGSALDTQEEKS